MVLLTLLEAEECRSNRPFGELGKCTGDRLASFKDFCFAVDVEKFLTAYRFGFCGEIEQYRFESLIVPGLVVLILRRVVAHVVVVSQPAKRTFFVLC